jgi:hypothetical protein
VKGEGSTFAKKSSSSDQVMGIILKNSRVKIKKALDKRLELYVFMIEHELEW